LLKKKKEMASLFFHVKKSYVVVVKKIQKFTKKEKGFHIGINLALIGNVPISHRLKPVCDVKTII
jgi:hypothetical protein